MGTIVDVKEQWSGENGGFSVDDEGRSGSAQFARSFTVAVDNSGGVVTAPQVASSTLLPRNGEAHPFNFAFRCRELQVERVSPVLFEATAVYRAETSDASANPLDEPAEVEYSTITAEEEIDEDIFGNPLNTVNGEPYTGITIPIADLSASITKNIPAFDPVSIYLYVNTVNSQPFLGFPAGVARMTDLRGRLNFGDDFSYWQVSAQFQFRKPIRTTAARAWWIRVRHEGRWVRQFDPFQPDVFPVVHATDDDGNKITKPVMLKPDGTEETDKTKAHWLEFQVFETRDFNLLGLGV